MPYLKFVQKWFRWIFLFAALSGCEREGQRVFEGYVTGDFVLVGAPTAGRLVKLSVERGHRVKAGAELFSLDPQPERAELDNARANLQIAEMSLADILKGERPSEIATLEHAKKAVQAAQVFTDLQLKRFQDLYKTKVIAQENLNLYQSADLALMEITAALESSIESAKLGGRSDQVAASHAKVGVAQALLAQAQWTLDQKTQRAMTDALVFDTIFHPGEWIPAGQGIVSLLPPDRVRVRFFVPEKILADVKIGESVSVAADGMPPTTGRVVFVSPTAEYAPPVIFSRESREQLLFMVEAAFVPDVAATMHPGQPVQVSRILK